MTKAEAIAKYESKWWEGKTPNEIVDFQLYEARLCCPFEIFHKAIEMVLRRPVFTHEFADNRALQEEYEGKRKYDGLIPSIKRVTGDKPIFLVGVDSHE
jgi:hypothetical protein